VLIYKTMQACEILQLAPIEMRNIINEIDELEENKDILALTSKITAHRGKG
jgi:hypothetical protein